MWRLAISLLLASLACVPTCVADDKLNAAYLAGGIALVSYLNKSVEKEIASLQEELTAIRKNAERDDVQEPYFKRNDPSGIKFVYKTSNDRKTYEDDRVNQIKLLKRKINLTWAPPVLREVKIGQVGRMNASLHKRVPFGDYDQGALIEIDSMNGKEFYGSIVNSEAPTLFFKGFDREDVAIGVKLEIKDIVEVMPASASPNGDYLTIRKLSPDELEQASKYAEENKPKQLNPYLREWSDTAGKFKITAELVDATAKEATFKKADGSTIKVPTSKLSKADRDWIKENY